MSTLLTLRLRSVAELKKPIKYKEWQVIIHLKC